LLIRQFQSSVRKLIAVNAQGRIRYHSPPGRDHYGNGLAYTAKVIRGNPAGKLYIALVKDRHCVRHAADRLYRRFVKAPRRRFAFGDYVAQAVPAPFAKGRKRTFPHRGRAFLVNAVSKSLVRGNIESQIKPL